MVQLSSEAVAFGVKEGMPVMFVTEDTTRAHPDTLRALYGAAIDAGARRLCVCDTCGHATPTGVRRLLKFVREIADEKGVEVGIDWHGHRDRGLGLINALVAIEAGASRIHGSALGVGERAGNTEMDLLLVNLGLVGWIDRDLTALGAYVQKASDAIGIPFPDNYPVFGSDAFETATGRARRGRRQGVSQGRLLARGPRLLGRAGRHVRPRAAHPGRPDERQVERQLGAREERRRGDRRDGRPACSRSRNRRRETCRTKRVVAAAQG